MLQNHATLSEIRKHLYTEVSRVYSGSETTALVTLIMEHCGYPSPQSLLNPHHRPGTATVAQINEIVADIHTNRPIQYILGTTSFCDLTIRVDENVLIPRPETEEMVYKIISETKTPPTRILDLCTGTGCIALALKKQFPDARVTALDISTPALELARINGKNNHLEVAWIQWDILSAELLRFPDKFDLVVSNPPYVLMSEQDRMDLNVLNFEPHASLFVEDSDPLIFYRAIARHSLEMLSAGGTVWLEINEKFGLKVTSLMSDSGFTKTTIHKDIHEKERFIKARS